MAKYAKKHICTNYELKHVYQINKKKTVNHEDN